MRDKYNRITPDFEAWKKLGYRLAEEHEHTYTLEDDKAHVWDFTQIICDYDDDDVAPKYFKDRLFIDIGFKPKGERVDFTPEEQAQINKDIKNWKEEVKKIVYKIIKICYNNVR